MTCRHSGLGVAALALATGCDPLINVYGSYFPAWAFCLLFGVVVAGVLRAVFAATGLEEGFAPVLLVYPALVLLVTCVTWLLLFRCTTALQRAPAVAGTPPRPGLLSSPMEVTPAELAEWEAEFEAAARRPLRTRLRYAFIRTYKPVLDDATYRSFDSMADYRRWCEENLPSWLGYARTV